jgi:predicted nucleotidyltransferase
MSARIRSTIASNLQRFPSITSAWGFGSFFRGGEHQDIDILVVVAVPHERLLDTSRKIRASLFQVQRTIDVPIDLLVLTEAEFESRPLRDMHELVPIVLIE